MPKLPHESFVRAFDTLLTQKLDAYEGEEVDRPLQQFDSCGMTDVEMVTRQAKAVAEEHGLTQPSCYRPDASWRLFDICCRRQLHPGLVVEVCSTQSNNDAPNKLSCYFSSTNAEVRCLTIVDLTHAGLKATVSVYVANYDCPS
jgi:hypothetical protein